MKKLIVAVTVLVSVLFVSNVWAADFFKGESKIVLAQENLFTGRPGKTLIIKKAGYTDMAAAFLHGILPTSGKKIKAVWLSGLLNIKVELWGTVQDENIILYSGRHNSKYIKLDIHRETGFCYEKVQNGGGRFIDKSDKFIDGECYYFSKAKIKRLF